MANSKQESNYSSSDIDYEYYDRKPTKKIILIILAIVAIAGVSYFVFIKNPQLFAKKEAPAIADTSTVSTTEPEPVPVNEPAPTVAEPVKPASGSKYHIIAGAFIVDKNASAFMQELQKKGYEPQIILKRNQFNFISIYSFPTFREANNKYKSLESSGMPIWIMKYKI